MHYSSAMWEPRGLLSGQEVENTMLPAKCPLQLCGVGLAITALLTTHL